MPTEGARMNTNSFGAIESLDLGTPKPTSVPLETVEVVVDGDNLIGNYGIAFINEATRVNPLKMEQVKLTSDEIMKYCRYLVHKRVQCVKMDCPDWRKLKVMYIPVFIQYVISMIGEVTIRDRGLKIVPITTSDEDPMTYEEALAVSEKIGSFMDDLQIVQDAMPRDRNGNVDVMSSALIAGYVKALKPVEHVVATYVAAFLGMKLRQEAAFQVLYRVQYDDLNFIAAALTSTKAIY